MGMDMEHFNAFYSTAQIRFLSISGEGIEASELIFRFGTEENKKALRAEMQKLILSVELKFWEKAEKFAEYAEKLLQGADEEIKDRLKEMKQAIQERAYEPFEQAYLKLANVLEERGVCYI